MVKHFLQFRDFTREELEYLFARTRVIKDRFKRYEKYHPLEDRTLAMIFEKSSTGTRLSFEAGMHQLTIPYSGTPSTTYTAAQPLVSPDGQTVAYYFVLTAFDTSGNESVKSNEVSATIDFLSPGAPSGLTVSVTLQP